MSKKRGMTAMMKKRTVGEEHNPQITQKLFKTGKEEDNLLSAPDVSESHVGKDRDAELGQGNKTPSASIGSGITLTVEEKLIVVAAVCLHLIVVNWSGDEVAQLEVEPSDNITVGLRQIEEQLGVAVSRQRLVCGEDALKPVEMWSSYSSVRDWATIQLTVLQLDAASDREALMVIFDSCGGADWDRKANWGSSEPLSSWDCVEEVDAEGRVTKLHLGVNNLAGCMPPEIGNLTALTVLNLQDNLLTDAIPSSIGELTALQGLILCYNLLTGAIPPEIGNLGSLKRLILSDNLLTDAIPPEICNLVSLKILLLDCNKLTGVIPPSIGNLSALTHLFLNENQLTGSIPPSICNLTALSGLDLSDNQIPEATDRRRSRHRSVTQEFLLFLRSQLG